VYEQVKARPLYVVGRVIRRRPPPPPPRSRGWSRGSTD